MNSSQVRGVSIQAQDLELDLHATSRAFPERVVGFGDGLSLGVDCSKSLGKLFAADKPLCCVVLSHRV